MCLRVCVSLSLCWDDGHFWGRKARVCTPTARPARAPARRKRVSHVHSFCLSCDLPAAFAFVGAFLCLCAAPPRSAPSQRPLAAHNITFFRSHPSLLPRNKQTTNITGLLTQQLAPVSPVRLVRRCVFVFALGVVVAPWPKMQHARVHSPRANPPRSTATRPQKLV